MSDVKLYYGKYKPVTCEWTLDKDRCRRPTLAGKSYCDDHYHRVFVTMSDDEVDNLVDSALDVWDKIENK
jgi:hypothetical protein